MKILTIANKIPYPPKDGGSIATFNLISGLESEEHNITLLSMNTSKHYVKPSQIPQDIKHTYKLQLVPIDISINYVDMLCNLLFSNMPYNAVRFINNEFEKSLIQLLKKDNYDIVQLEGLYLAPYIATIREHSKALIAMRSHNIEHEIWRKTALQQTSFLKKRYFLSLSERIKTMEIEAIKEYDLLVPITERDANIFVGFGATCPIHVCSVGIDFSKIKQSNSDKKTRNLFHIGALDWPPNKEGIIWFLDNCWGDIIKKLPDTTLNIAGRNAPKWLEEKLRSTKNIVYHGEIDDATQFMNNNDIMLVPLLSGGGMRVKIVEGMSLGKVVVSTKQGVEGINCKHNEHLVVANTKEEFIADVIKCIVDNDFFREIGEKARTFAHHNFDNKSIASKLASFYTENLNAL